MLNFKKKKWILEGHVWDQEEMVCAVGLPHVLASIPFLKEWQVKLKINQYKITKYVWKRFI